jgi:hypothetical protein
MTDRRPVCGIDPGPREFSWVVWDGARVIECGDAPNYHPGSFSTATCGSRIAIEWIESFGMAVGREVFETVFSIGRMATLANVRLVPRRDVKLHICGSPRAKDGNIRQALIDRFGPVGTKKAPGPLWGISKHRWAALAVAVTAFDLEHTEHEATFHRDRG